MVALFIKVTEKDHVFRMFFVSRHRDYGQIELYRTFIKHYMYIYVVYLEIH